MDEWLLIVMMLGGSPGLEADTPTNSHMSFIEFRTEADCNAMKKFIGETFRAQQMALNDSGVADLRLFCKPKSAGESNTP